MVLSIECNLLNNDYINAIKMIKIFYTKIRWTVIYIKRD